MAPAKKRRWHSPSEPPELTHADAPGVACVLPLVIRPSPERVACPQAYSYDLLTPRRQESPNAPMVEGTKKRDNETVTEEVGSKHARRAPDVSNSPPKTFEPDTTSPVKMGDFGAAAPLDKLPRTLTTE